MSTAYPFIFISVLVVGYIITRIITKSLHSRRDSQFQELAQEFGMQTDFTPQILEGQGANPFGIKMGNVKFLQERKISGVVNGKSIIIQDSLGKGGQGINSFLSPEYGGRGSLINRVTTIYVNDEIVSNKASFFQGYMPISDIKKYITSI